MKSSLLFTATLTTFLLNGIIFTASAQSVTAAALYVNDSTTTGDVFTRAAGDDVAGDGSATAPFATVAHALAQADASVRTIFIDAGTYTERVVLDKAISLQGAGTATAQAAAATVFNGGLLPAATQTSEAGLLITTTGGTPSQPLTIADITFQAYDYGIQADGSANQANFLLEDIETVHNRRQGIFWRSLGGVQNLTFRRIHAAYTAESGNSDANGAGRGLFLVNGHKEDILIENGLFEFNRRNGIDVNDGSVSNLTVRNNQFTQNLGGALVVLGAAGARTSTGTFTSIAALIEGNAIRNNASNGMELKACTGNGSNSGAGSFVVRNNYVARTIGAPTNLSEDNAGLAFIDRDRDIITVGGGITGDLVTGGAYVANNTIRGYLADTANSTLNINGFGMVLEGAANKVFGNVVAQCQRAIQVQDRPANSTGYTPFFDISGNGYVVSSGNIIRGNRLDSCATAIRTVNLTNPVDASINWLGANTVVAVRGTAGISGQVVTLDGPAASFAQVAAAAGKVDYSPFVHTATDADPALGFQPSFDHLNIDPTAPQSSGDSPLAEAVALVTEQGTVSLAAGLYEEALVVDKSLTLTNNGATTLKNITLDGPDKVLTLGAPLTLSGELTLERGLLRTSSTALLTLTDEATATEGNAASYIDGPVRKQGQRPFVFPVGKNGRWARLAISAPADPATTFTAEYFTGPHAVSTTNAPLSKVSQLEHWTLEAANATAPVSVRLFWESNFQSGIDDFSSDLQVATFTGTEWETAGNDGLTGNLGAGSVVSSQPLNGFTAFTFGSLSSTANPLSTQISTFVADQPRPGVVDLEWTLTGENNTYGYAVERAPAANASWQQIGFVASQGITTQPRVYTYQDQNVQGMTQALYRLRQVDAAGAVRYSSVASVTLTSGPLANVAAQLNQVALFPNPAHNQVTLRLPGTVRAATRLTLTDLSGRLVLTETLRSAETTVTLPTSLPAGVYLLQVQGAGLSGKPQRLVIQ